MLPGKAQCFHRGQRVASHVRSQQRGRHTTLTAHMPEAHRQQVEWTPERFIRWAQQNGPATAQVVTHILASRRHPQQGFRACLGVMRLGRAFGSQRLEAACRRAAALNTYRYKSLESILKNGLDSQPLPEPVSAPASVQDHDNLRGPHYYH